jgi:hypothetical protein
MKITSPFRHFGLMCVYLLLFCYTSIYAQTATYRLHREASSTSGQFQLKTANPDAAILAIQSAEFKNTAVGEKLIKQFDTQSGVPNLAGTIPSGSIVTFNLWMKKTANVGTMFPRAKLYKRTSAGALTLLATATGTQAITTTLVKYTFTTTLGTSTSMVATDRFQIWVGVNLTATSSTKFKAELDIEGTVNGNYDSSVTIPLPVQIPSISSISPTSGTVGTAVTINGTNFGATQGTSTVKFNGTTATPSSWSNTSITASVPSGAATGNVVVTVGGQASNGMLFTVTTPNAPPAVSITSPSNNANFNLGSDITINANATDSDGTITKVEFFQGTTKLGEDTASPYSFTWSNVQTDSYSLTAKATDNNGASSTSTAVNIEVAGSAPSVNLTSPVNNATFTIGSNITIGATATDSDGTVVKVEFYQGAIKIGEDTTAQYSFTWNNVSAGTYSLTAKATDNSGNVSTSNPVLITVSGDAQDKQIYRTYIYDINKLMTVNESAQ